MKLAPVLVLAWASVAWSENDKYNTCPFTHEFANSGYNLFKNDLSAGVKKTCRPKDSYQAASGCVYTIRCKEPESPTTPGYYFEGDYAGEGVKIKCRASGKWTTADGGDPVPKCIQGCLVPSRAEMENSTFKLEPRDVYTTEYGQKLYAAGAVLETQCKNGFVFTDPKFEEKGYDRHICKAGKGSGWYDDIKKKDYGWPAKCAGVCPPYSKTLPEGVEIVQNPETNPNAYKDYGNGTIVLLDKAQYKLRCKEGYKPANPKHTNGEQELNCLSGSWHDKQTEKGDAKPLECIAQGCPDVTKYLPPNAYTEASEDCGAGAAKKDGCRITIKCKQTDGRPNGLGWYMPGKPNGFGLKCVKSTWQTEDGSPAMTNGNGVYGECSAGCVGLTGSDKVSTEVIQNYDGTASQNGDIMVYSGETTVTTGCKDNYIRPGLTEQPTNGETFKCKAHGWENIKPELVAKNIFPNSCSPACEIPDDPAGGTVYNTPASISIKKGKRLVPKGSRLETQCKDKFRPPADMPSRAQTLVCEGGNLGWMAVATNKTNEIVLRCERDGAAGCTLVQNSTTTETHYVGECTPTEDNLLPPSCKIVIKCKPGFFPEVPVDVDGSTGEQSLECKAGNDGYVDHTNNKKNVTTLKCVQACEFFDSVKGAIYVTRPQDSDFIGTYAGKKFVRPGTRTITRCGSFEDGYYYNNNNDLERAQKGIFNVVHICMGGSQKYQKELNAMTNRMPGDMCGPVCDALDSDATHDVREKFRENSASFFFDSKLRAVNMEYEIKCRRGFEFPPGSKEASQGAQKLLCVGGGNGYMDLSNNANNSRIAPCTKVADPRCPPIDLSNSQIEITGSYGNCNPASGQFDQGCELTLKCADGSFPHELYQGSSANQKITCKILANNTAVWVQGNNGASILPLKCEKGCEVVKEKPSFTITNSPKIVTSGGVSYYRKGEAVNVRCNPGFIPRFETRLDPQDGEYGISYVCFATDPSMPWQNTKNFELDKGPSSVCVKTCPALRADKEGVKIHYGPMEKGTDTGPMVSGGGVYTLKCITKYHYANANLRPNNEQRLYCDPETGHYVDITNGNETRASVAACIPIDVGSCRDLPVSNGKKVSSCLDGNKPGCKETIRCNDGYIPGDSKYYQTGAQELQCNEEAKWVDSDKKEVFEAMKCEPACRYDETVIGSNINVDMSTSITVKVNNIDYVVGGTSLKVTCKGEGVIWMENVKETTTAHEYKCSGGSAGYKRESNNQVNVTLGDSCVGTCLALTEFNVDKTVNVKHNPRTYVHNGQTLIIDGDGYGFECQPDYVYQDKRSIEWFRCNQKTRRFESNVGAPFVKPTSCIRNSNNDECKKVSLNTVTTEVYIDECSPTGDYYKSDCIIRFRCKGGYQPNNIKYHTMDGLQMLKCDRKGRGWSDQKGDPVETAMDCIPGCVNYSAPQKPEDLIFKEYAHPQGDSFRNVTCYEPVTHKNGTVLIVSNFYGCSPKNADDYFKKTCDGACRAIPARDFRNVIMTRKPERLSTSSEFVFADTFYQLECQPGYEYPPGSPHAAKGSQILRCLADTGNYFDELLKISNASIAECVEKSGCKKLANGQGVVDQSSCHLNGDAYRDQCTVEYNCAKGYYPADKTILYEGSQKVRCDGKKQTWDYKGTTIYQTPVCLSGCSELGYTTVANYLSDTKVDIAQESVRDSMGGKHRCYTTKSFQEIKKIIQQVQNQNSPYFCKTKDPVTNTETLTDSNIGCPGTCIAMDTRSPPSGVRIKSKPGEFETHGNKYVATGDYVFECTEGFAYDEGTYEAQRKEQRVTCHGNGSLIDAATGLPANAIKSCKQTPSCENLASPLVSFTPGASCGSNNGQQPVNCEMTAKCQQGSYPSDKEHQKKVSVSYTCKVNSMKQPVWVDSATNVQAVNVLKCIEGCIPVANISQSIQSLSVKLLNATCTKRNYSNLQQLPDAAKQYYCELQDGVNPNVVGFTCQGACKIPTPDPSVIITHSEPGKEIMVHYELIKPRPEWDLPNIQLEPINEVLSASCPSGMKFEDTQTARRTLLCSADTNMFTENQKVVNKLGRCV